jgi:guanosine-3',5'-bis(diphosphate) 3'-pyrophosphohydrolase
MAQIAPAWRMLCAIVLPGFLMKDFTIAQEFARNAHRNQIRKYTGLPYVSHVIAVSEIVAAHGGDDNQVIAALLHDTVEDTEVTLESVRSNFGDDVAKLVEELTNVYQEADYPHLSRAVRKTLEAERLGKISARAQTIKYADFLNNGEDILAQDAAFARVYLREMAHKLELMTLGDPQLKQEVLTRVINA